MTIYGGKRSPCSPTEVRSLIRHALPFNIEVSLYVSSCKRKVAPEAVTLKPTYRPQWPTFGQLHIVHMWPEGFFRNTVISLPS